MENLDRGEDRQPWTPTPKPKKSGRGVPKASSAMAGLVNDYENSRKRGRESDSSPMEAQKTDAHDASTFLDRNAELDNLNYSGFPQHSYSQDAPFFNGHAGYLLRPGDDIRKVYGFDQQLESPITLSASTNLMPNNNLYSGVNLPDSYVHNYGVIDEPLHPTLNTSPQHEANDGSCGTNQHSSQRLIGTVNMPGESNLVPPQPKDDGSSINKAIKTEEEMPQTTNVSSSPGQEQDEGSEYEDRPSKIPKLNKDGLPRKARAPRPKLLKWDDNDWKNVALGIVWACGDSGIQIPFAQASQIVSDRCTSGALQQALLKLREKQIAEGYQIPPLKMSWSRSSKSAPISGYKASTNVTQDLALSTPLEETKKSSRMAGTQSLLIVLGRPYIATDRLHLGFPYRFLKRAPKFSNVFTPKGQTGCSNAGSNDNARNEASITPGRSLAPPARAEPSTIDHNSQGHFSVGTVFDASPAGSAQSLRADLEPLDWADEEEEEEREVFKLSTSTGPFSGFTGRLAPETSVPLRRGGLSYHYRNKSALDGSALENSQLHAAARLLPRTSQNPFAVNANLGPINEGRICDTPSQAPNMHSPTTTVGQSFSQDTPRPFTPPNSAAAEARICDNFNSTISQSGAFNPQGNGNVSSIDGELVMHRQDYDTAMSQSLDLIEYQGLDTSPVLEGLEFEPEDNFNFSDFLSDPN